MDLGLKMTSDRKGKTESGKVVEAGTTIYVVGRADGGFMKVKLPDESVENMPYECFPQTRWESKS